MTSSGNPPLEGTVSFVTGAAGGLGRATVVALAEAGSTVVGTDLAGQPADLPVDLWLPHDVSSEEAWAEVAGAVRDRYGRLDCLVNNAGYIELDPLEKTTLATWRRIQSINVESVLLSFHAFLPLLRESGEKRVGGASVVNVSSPAGVRGSAFAGAYSASKAAMTNLTYTAAKEFGKLGYPIRLNNVYPGGANNMGMAATVRKRYQELGLATGDDDAQWLADVPAGRLCEPSEIAAGIVFLSSPAASYISGIDLPVHGGAIY